MNTDKLTTTLGFLTTLFAGGAAVAGYTGNPLFAVALGALAAASHGAQSYLTNKPSSQS